MMHRSLLLLALSAIAVLAPTPRAQQCVLKGIISRATVTGTDFRIFVQRLDTSWLGCELRIGTLPPIQVPLNASQDAFELQVSLPVAPPDDTTYRVTIIGPSPTFGDLLFKPAVIEADSMLIGPMVFGSGRFQVDAIDGQLTGVAEFSPPIAPTDRVFVKDSAGNVILGGITNSISASFSAKVGALAVTAFLDGLCRLVVENSSGLERANVPIRPRQGRMVGVGDGSQAVPPTPSPGKVFADVTLLPDDRLFAKVIADGINAFRCDVIGGLPGQVGTQIFRPMPIAPNVFFGVSQVLTAIELQAYLDEEVYVKITGVLSADNMRAQLSQRAPSDIFGPTCPALGGEMGVATVDEGPLLGFGVGLTLIGAAPNAVAVHLLGVGEEGPYQSLAPIGQPGCFQMFDPLEMRGIFTTNTIGAANDFVPIPPFVGFLGLRVNSQWATVEADPSSPLGLHFGLSRAAQILVMP